MKIKEKYQLIKSLLDKDKELVGSNRLAMMGQGDFPGKNSPMRATMNTKHHNQHLTIDNPEFPFVFNGNENMIGAYSSFYYRTDRNYRVIKIIKKFDELLRGHSNFALYFLHCEDDDSYRVIERKESENLTENFGFDYRNNYLDMSEVDDMIPSGTVLYASTSYDDDMNVGIGVNGLMLYGVHPAVQDDAIIVSESFAKRMVSNQVTSKTIPVNDNTIFVNLYGDSKEYQCLPNIGDTITNGILAATRQIKETRMFSDLRDSSLTSVNFASDQIYYCDRDAEVIDINIYSNNPNLKLNKINRQLIQYYNDLKFFYSEIYRTCRNIKNSGSKDIDREISRWLRRAKEYLDEEAKWDFNDNIFSNLMVQILLRKKCPILTGQKITGRSGNKTVTSKIIPDSEMPFITTDTTTDQYGVVHPVGKRVPVELVTNPLAIINRTIPMALIEGSITFISARTREFISTLDDQSEQERIIFRVIEIFNPDQASDMRAQYATLSEREKRKYIESVINDGLYVKIEAFDDNIILRDAIIQAYDEFANFLRPYDLFTPKPNWGRDIHIGKFHIGYQYIMMLKQSGERGFSVRSAGAISDESLPEKSNTGKTGLSWRSETPIRFGEYETPNFQIIVSPDDFALITALYRSSIDGRRFMYEAILSEDGEYEIPDKLRSRTADILQVYLKSLGVRMETVAGEDNYIGETEDTETVTAYTFRNNVIFSTPNEMYYVLQLAKTYRYCIRDNPMDILDFDEVWDMVLEHLPFKKKHLTDNVINLFKNNLEVLTLGGYT